MKTILTSFILLVSISLTAQVAIGTTAVESSDVLVQFGEELRGIVIEPSNAVTETNTNTAKGTIAFDASTGSFRYYNGTWSTALTGGTIGGAPTGTDVNQYFIGATTSITGGGTTNGVLILGTDTGEAKAMVLPKLCGGKSFFTPAELTPGLMYYERDSKMVMVYNGTTWVGY